MAQQSLRELINPSPRQEEFLQATDKHKYVLFGGAKGGGKSHILRWALIRKLLRWAKQGHKNVRVGLFCEDYVSLKDRQITKIQKEFPEWLGVLGENNIEGMSFRLKPRFGGGIIALRNLDEVSKYASSEFAIAAIDELTKNQREVFDQFRSIIRWPGIEDTGLWGATNPGEVGHLWVKKLWVDRIFGKEDPPGDQFKFIKSLPTDNPHNAESYLAELRGLPERLRKAYYDGNWDIFKGQYFTEWDKEQHTITPFPIPPHFKRFRVYDHGRENPACCLWGALDFDGRLWIYRELYVRGLDAEDIAKEINRLSAGETYDYSLADPAIFAKMGFVDKYGGQTLAETFARNGVMFIPASNRRIDGWNVMHQYLKWDEFHKPRIIFFNTCHDSIRTIPALVHDAVRVEDVDTKGEDHAGDCVRYLLMSLHERKGTKPLTDVEKKLVHAKEADASEPWNLYNE